MQAMLLKIKNDGTETFWQNDYGDEEDNDRDQGSNAAIEVYNAGSSTYGYVGTGIHHPDSNECFEANWHDWYGYKTTNGGGAWNTTTIEGVSFVDFYFMNAATGIAAANHESGYKSIWRTTNGGESWNNVYEAENYFINAIWFTSETTGWAVGYYDKMGWGHLPAIQKSIDGGLTWQNIYINRYPGPTKGEELLDIRFKNEMEGFAVSTYMESVITSDGGQTWKVTYDDEGTAMIPDWGIYKILDGDAHMYLIGRKGYVTKWK
jgi:photosystem II stability/assembly factor-like uncharacterized protein